MKGVYPQISGGLDSRQANTPIFKTRRVLRLRAVNKWMNYINKLIYMSTGYMTDGPHQFRALSQLVLLYLRGKEIRL